MTTKTVTEAKDGSEIAADARRPTRVIEGTLSGLWRGAAAFAAALVILELLFRFAHIGQDEIMKLHPVIGYYHLQNHSFTWRQEGVSRGRFNDSGIRDDAEYSPVKPPGALRIALLGDSMTEGLQVPLAETFGKVLERDLADKTGRRCEVINFAMSGFSTLQELYLYRSLVGKYRPDLVIVGYHVGDNEKNMLCGKPEDQPPRPYGSIDPRGRLQVDWRAYRLGVTREKIALDLALEWLRRNSRIWCVWQRADLAMSQDKAYEQVRRIVSPLCARLLIGAAIAFTGEKKLDVVAAQFRSPERWDRQAKALNYRDLWDDGSGRVPKSPKSGSLESFIWQSTLTASEDRFKVTAAAIAALSQDVKADGGKLLVLALPAPNNSVTYFRELNRLSLQSVKQGFGFLSLQERFPSLAPMQRSPLYFDVHFSRSGHKLVADCIANYLAKSKLIHM